MVQSRHRGSTSQGAAGMGLSRSGISRVEARSDRTMKTQRTSGASRGRRMKRLCMRATTMAPSSPGKPISISDGTYLFPSVRERNCRCTLPALNKYHHRGDYMPKRQNLRVLAAIIGALTLLSSCSQPPSNDIIKSAILECLKYHVPSSWSGSILGSKDVHIQSVAIVTVGKFNEKEKSWPVYAQVSGTCQAIMFNGPEVTQSFNTVGTFWLYQDDHGNWKAFIEGLR